MEEPFGSGLFRRTGSDPRRGDIKREIYWKLAPGSWTRHEQFDSMQIPATLNCGAACATGSLAVGFSCFTYYFFLGQVINNNNNNNNKKK